MTPDRPRRLPARVTTLVPVALALCLSVGLPAQRPRPPFSAEGRLLTQGRIFSIASADLDGNGRPDIAVSDFIGHARVVFNDPDRAFARVATLTSAPEAAREGHGVAVADFDGDRRLDLFLVYNGGPSRLLFGDGTGRFRDSGRAIGAPDLNGTAVEAADIDGDGDIDALVSHYQQKDLVYSNDGKGAFTASGQAFEGNATLVDVDGDGDPDAACVPGGGTGPVSIWLNTRGRFTPSGQLLDVGDGIASVTAVDLDGDRDLDLVVLGRTARTTLWDNDGRGVFQRRQQTIEPGTRMAAGDIDRDGRPDLVVGSTVYLNSGSGRLDGVQALDLGDLVTALLLVDTDQDGDLDLIATRGSRQAGTTDLLLFENLTTSRAAGPAAGRG